MRTSPALGVAVVTGREVRSVAELGDGISVLHGGPGHDDQDWLEADAVVLALDPVGLRRVVADVPGPGGDDAAGAAWRESVAGIRSAPAFAVWRLWLSGQGGAGAAAVPRHERLRPARQRLGARAVRGARHRRGARTTTARSSSCTPTRCPSGTDEVDLRAADARRAAPGLPRDRRRSTSCTTSGSSQADCVLVGLEPWRSRPGVRTPDPRVLLAGDAVRCDLPVALMERAATTGCHGGRPAAHRRGASAATGCGRCRWARGWGRCRGWRGAASGPTARRRRGAARRAARRRRGRRPTAGSPTPASPS